MANITVVSKIRFLAGLAPVILLVASPLMALAFLEFGNIPSNIKDEQVAAIKFAEAADAALYQMEWGRFQPDGVQIIVDQQRRFADVLDSAAHRIYTEQQRAKLETLANEAKPTLDAFRHADPHDDAMTAKMRDLHTMVSDLENADDAALEEYSEAVKTRVHELMAVAVVAGIIVPMICFALIWQLSADMRNELRAIRSELENVAESAAAKEPIARMIETIDQGLTRMGFPKPNPMLADE